MNILFILIPITVLISLGFLWGFLWAVRKGQFKDLQTPALKVLFEDSAKENTKKEKGAYYES